MDACTSCPSLPANLVESASTLLGVIEFTSRCNLRCVYCTKSTSGYVQGVDLDTEFIGQVANALVKRKVRCITVNGHGETTIHKGWRQCCERLLDQGVQLNIITNLAKQLTDDEIAVLARFKAIELSIDTVDPVLFSQLRRGAALNVVLTNMLRIMQCGAASKGAPPSFSWSCVVSDANALSLSRLVQKGVEFGVRQFSFCNLVEYPVPQEVLKVRHVASRELPFIERVSQEISLVIAMLNRSGTGYTFASGLTDSIDRRLKGGEVPEAEPAVRSATKYTVEQKPGTTRNCLDAWSMAMIHADGSVAPCCAYPSIGSLHDSADLNEILNNDALRRLRAGLLSGDLESHCVSCTNKAWVSVEQFRVLVKEHVEKYG